jgi:hypothetical protein
MRLAQLVLAASAAAAASPAASQPAPSGACVLFIPASLEGFGLGELRADGAVAPLWSTRNDWAGILGGAFAARGAGAAAFVTQPTRADSSTPLATLRLRSGGANASIEYAALSPVPGHEGAGAPAALAFANDAARGRVVAVVSSADGAFSFYTIASFEVNASAAHGDGDEPGGSEAGGATEASGVAAAPPAVALRALRDVTAEVAALGGQLDFGLAALDSARDELFLAFAGANASSPSTVAAFSLANASAPPTLVALPRGASAISLQYSRAEGLLVLAQDAAQGALEWLALGGVGVTGDGSSGGGGGGGSGGGSGGDSGATVLKSVNGDSPWTRLFSYERNVTAPEIGVGAASADGAALFALVLDPAGLQLSASFVDVAARNETKRIAFSDKGLIAVDIAECRAAA